MLVGLALVLLSAVPQKDCDKTSYGVTPLNDLGAGSYLGEQGGLYPGGTNARPALHEAHGRRISRTQVVPRDEAGLPDPNGRIGFISIGLSNTTQEFQVFLELLAQQDDLHPRLLSVDCAKGGVGLEKAVDPADPANYWPFVDQRLALAGLDHDQVQVVWLKTAYGNPPSTVFPGWQYQQAMDLARLLNLVQERFPNVRLAYLSSRIYGHYSTSVNREEPTAYESGFGFKWVIQGQLQGIPALNYDPQFGPIQAPWLSWGPYLWGDGIVPRSDDLQWLCEDYNDDGHHPGPLGRLKVAEMLLEFFRTDATTRPWFLGPARAGDSRLTGPKAAPGNGGAQVLK